MCMQHRLTSFAVFCGASSGGDAVYRDIAYRLGQAIAAAGATVVYGGACSGLMGEVANGALSAAGEVIGVLPGFLQTKEIAHTGLSKLIIVDSMHERKLRMHELSDAIIALPGGWGTMEELTEMLTWAQLGLHSKPIGLLNAGGFYDGFLQLIDTMQREGFLKAAYAKMLLVADNIDRLLSLMEAYVAPDVPVWITENRT